MTLWFFLLWLIGALGLLAILLHTNRHASCAEEQFPTRGLIVLPLLWFLWPIFYVGVSILDFLIDHFTKNDKDDSREP